MSSITRLKNRCDRLTEREAQYKREALEQAKERAREDREAVYRELHELVRVDGVSISAIGKETGLSRSTIYRWLDEHDRLAAYIEESPTPGWIDVKLMATGEVAARDIDGNLWVLSSDGEAWNKSSNEVIEGRSNWPDGAAEAFDSVQATE